MCRGLRLSAGHFQRVTSPCRIPPLLTGFRRIPCPCPCAIVRGDEIVDGVNSFHAAFPLRWRGCEFAIWPSGTLVRALAEPLKAMILRSFAPDTLYAEWPVLAKVAGCAASGGRTGGPRAAGLTCMFSLNFQSAFSPWTPITIFITTARESKTSA